MSAAPPSRGAALGLAALCLALGAFLTFVAYDGLAPLADAGQAGPRRLTVSTGAAAALPAALALLSIAALPLLPEGRAQRFLWRLVLGCLPFLFAAPLALHLAATARLPGLGYQRCDGPVAGFRFLTTEWARENACVGRETVSGRRS